MKKIIFASVFALLVSIGFSSCRKCEVCTKESEPEVRICENDYDSNTEYGLALDALEAGGYDCK